jgi:hypothetical protein
MDAMKTKVTCAALALWSGGAMAHVNAPPIRNPAILNIGFVCRWQTSCIRKQAHAMEHSLKYVQKYDPPTWKIQLCNRNASRNSARVDWIGFSNCVRNQALRPQPRLARRRPR